MDDTVFSFFKRLADAPSPSGYEQPAQRVWREYVAPHVDEVKSDVMGNTWGVLRGPDRPRVMLAGHVDEIGLMVQYVDDQGFLYFAAIGGVTVVRDGLGLGPAAEAEAHAAMTTPEFEIVVELQEGAGEATVTTCDLTADYVRINADYRS